MRDYYDLVVEVYVKLPNSHTSKCYSIPVSACLCQSFTPLPPNRELPFCVEEQVRAREMKIDRKRLAEMLEGELIKAILKTVEENDTVNGYKKDEI